MIEGLVEPRIWKKKMQNSQEKSCQEKIREFEKLMKPIF